jgi:hypothetical protein
MSTSNEGTTTTTATETKTTDVAASTTEAKGTVAGGTPAAETKKTEGTEAGKTAEGTKTTEPKAEEKKPEVPEKYDLVPPKDSKLDQKHLDAVGVFAKENKLTQEQAQSLLNRDHALISAREKAQLDAFNHQADVVWVDQLKADKEIGGDNFPKNAELAKRVVAKFGSDSLKNELNRSGFGNHPELVRLLVRVGKSMGEDSFETHGAAASGEKSAAELLYPNHAKK